MGTTRTKQGELIEAPKGALYELWYYYGAGGQFPVLEFVSSVEQAQTVLAAKKYFSADLYRPGESTPIMTWEREEAKQ
jgi:hypothetical protein